MIGSALASLFSGFRGGATRKKIDYQEKLAQEIAVYNQVENVHALPEIFHYWSHNYLRPKFIAVGVRGIHEFFLDHMLSFCSSSSKIHRFVSIGSGRCEIEIEIGRLLTAAGCVNFIFECIDINHGMLEGAKGAAESAGLDSRFEFVVSDALRWLPETDSCSVVMAHQSLHHIVDLEVLFDKIRRAIGREGKFLTSDVIGRNGHMRWPEAMLEIEIIWRDMPEKCKYNHALKRFEPIYENWDCSAEGFEGVRAQDILPLLQKYFGFEMFLGFGNLIDIFVDRAFGHNFNCDSEVDRAIIDCVAMRDDELIESGVLKPTHIIAVMRNQQSAPPLVYKHLTPQFCTRKPE